MGNEQLDRVLTQLTARRLSSAIAEMETFLAAYPQQTNSDRLYAIRSDFQLMADYWKRGYKDPQLAALYQNLLQRLYELYAQVAQTYATGHSAFLSSIYMRIHMTVRDWSPLNIKEEMETFVADLAMLELEPANKRKEKRQELYRQHQHTMNVLFDKILLSGVWTEGMATAMEEILLSPTVDSNDQQLLVSSVMLATLNLFDMAKFRTLIHVYQHASDEHVRQRALVGWALTANSQLSSAIYPEMGHLVGKVLESEDCCHELVELQKQIIFCINAEKDNQTIQKEIIPDLVNNNPTFRVTRDGLEEVEEDAMADILNPGESERKLEKLEESYQRMVDMQKQGSDIYFGGFSMMKRFPFFSEICNWFVPFFIDHPEISAAAERFKSNKFLALLVTNNAFCNSDKYSFVQGFQQVRDRLPASLLNMLDKGEAQFDFNMVMNGQDTNSAAYIRRIYLQDIYRFFRLFPRRAEFVNAFDNHDMTYLFCAGQLFSRTHLEPYFNEVVAFLMKQKRMKEAGLLLENYGVDRCDFQYYMMRGYLAQNEYCTFGDGREDALGCYAKALELQPDNERALQGFARALFSAGRFEEALLQYDRLVEINPQKTSYLLNRAVCLTNVGRYGAALKDLYQLNYHAPEDKNVNRVLAWTLTCDGKYEQAEKLFANLLTDKVIPADLLNYGYCLWFSGSVDEAADCFHRYLRETGEEAEMILENEQQLLKEKGISEAEQQMMLYIL